MSSWDLSPQLLLRIAHEAKEFLVTFPVGLNLRLDEARVCVCGWGEGEGVGFVPSQGSKGETGERWLDDTHWKLRS